MSHSLLICRSCRGGARARALIDSLAAALPDFTIGGVECMSGCTRPLAIGFRAEGKASYLFGDIDPGASPDDILAFARLYASLPDGWITDATTLGNLRSKALARIPVAPDQT